MAFSLCNRLPCADGVRWYCRRDDHSSTRPVRIASAIAGSVTNSVEQQGRGFRFQLSIGAKVIPHPDKVEKGGEDAFFISDFDGGVFGIADGVSGWAEENVDPALFSKELVNHLAQSVTSEEVRGDPKVLLGKAHAATSSKGAATAIVATLLGAEGLLRVASVGDCGLRLVRDGKVVFATSPQQHYFDCPYQFSSEVGGQTAEDSAVHEITIVAGDVVVMGSDGLFDNVFDRDIAATVTLFQVTDVESAERTATALATMANRNSRDPKYESPYSTEAIYQGFDVPIWRKLLGEKLTGGKLDDITVLVGVVAVTEIVEVEGENDEQSQSSIQKSEEAVVTNEGI
ncbi:probable protein phosphatase 2C 26 [Selaginella moellendorffii]|uniref:probable protein phosphatase 2C 26 n=1 Tax=Selaginella moellendorffii TaxID=88036 RepID=UPI000D1D0842|nr:probable protein phosphatase 2C 26 [Selaginella moellendorffii]|eukprot:XP_024538756.1 probable protein phosphatase 2C 26 [Selaginella moellendorffii]